MSQAVHDEVAPPAAPAEPPQVGPIGYLVGKFPNACHTYFHREVTELRRRGVQVTFCSTSRPQELPRHDWAQDAAAQTRYLWPLGLRGVIAAAWEVLRSGPRAWGRVLSSIRRADVPASARLRLGGYVLLGARLARLARREGWTHLHSGFCNDTANIALFAHLLSGLPYSISLHDTLATFGPNQNEKWRHAAFGTVITQKLRGELLAALRDPPAQIQIAPMGVELAAFSRRSPYEPWRGHGPARIFTCGRIVPTKGVVDLLEALALVRAAGIDATLTLAGEPFPRIDWYLALIEKKLDELSLRPYVTMLGGVGESAVRDHLEQAHLFALASHCEGLGVVLMEAMAMGVPVVATDAGGVPELIVHRRHGLLAEPQNPQALAHAIIELLSAPALAQTLAAAGRARVEEHFHAGRSAAVMLRCLQAAAIPRTREATSRHVKPQRHTDTDR